MNGNAFLYKRMKNNEIGQMSATVEISSKKPAIVEIAGFANWKNLVRVAGFEPTASWSRTKHATICATPGRSLPVSRTTSVALKHCTQEAGSCQRKS